VRGPVRTARNRSLPSLTGTQLALSSARALESRRSCAAPGYGHRDGARYASRTTRAIPNTTLMPAATNQRRAAGLSLLRRCRPPLNTAGSYPEARCSKKQRMGAPGGPRGSVCRFSYARDSGVGVEPGVGPAVVGFEFLEPAFDDVEPRLKLVAHLGAAPVALPEKSKSDFAGLHFAREANHLVADRDVLPLSPRSP
jgi:hypothetical protein